MALASVVMVVVVVGGTGVDEVGDCVLDCCCSWAAGGTGASEPSLVAAGVDAAAGAGDAAAVDGAVGLSVVGAVAPVG